MLYIIGLIIIALFIIPFLPVIIEIIYSHDKSRDDEDDEELMVNMYVGFKFINFRIRIPLVENRVLDYILKIKGKIESDLFKIFPGDGEIEFEGSLEEEEFINKFKDLYDLIKSRHHLLEVMSNLKMKCINLTWKTKLGLSDPAYTGLVIGFLWAFKGSIISYLDHKIFPIKERNLNITPLFSGKEFSFVIKGIFKIYLGNIILTGIKLLIFRIKGGLKEWPNTQLKS